MLFVLAGFTVIGGLVALLAGAYGLRETRRAELAHWWALWCSPLFLLWNPPLAAALLVSYGVLVNLPFIAIQRYNRFRTEALIERLSRRRSHA